MSSIERMHVPYENKLNHQADFRVKYQFRSMEAGGRKTLPFQGIRSDFSLADESENKMYMIWPEFEDSDGNLILYNDQGVPSSGTARMWIINSMMRPLHYDKIKVGVKGHFREGDMISADCEVIEILDLKINPTKNKY